LEPTAFDRVVIVDAAGHRRSYSAEEFLALPLALRIQHILARDVEFFRGHFKIERTEALKSLRPSAASQK
jgi:hypothetical protein